MVEKRLYQQREEEKNIRPFQTGTGIEYLTAEARYGFDITGYLILEDFLSTGQVREASRQLEGSLVSPPDHVTLRRNGPEAELLNVVECGGILEQAFVHGRLVQAMQQLIWGDQIRLVSSRAIVREPGISGHISQGGLADPRRYTRYRCFIDGEFRCLLVSCLIALNDTASSDGSFSVIPSSHKSNFPHPYGRRPPGSVAALKDLPLSAGSAVIFSESISHCMKSSRTESKLWLLYQYGPSYMVDLPGCEASPELMRRVAADETKARLLRKPYYHP